MQSKRNYGIDALKLFSMFMIIVLHILNQGGVLNNVNGKAYYLCYFFQIFSYSAVDCYAIISGYVGYTEKEKTLTYGKYGKLWLEVFFYSFTITLIFYIFQNETVDKWDLLHSMFPVSFNLYWYFTEYTALFFLMPWINRLIRGLSKRDTSILSIIIFCIFSVFTTFIQQNSMGFNLARGYSFVWLALLYIIGCWIKKCNVSEKINIKKALFWVIILVFIPFTYSVFSEFVSLDIGVNLVEYTSIFTLGTAVLLVVIFSKIKISKVLGIIVKFFSPATFGVYLIHVHPSIFEYVFKDSFIFISNVRIWMIPLFILISAFAILTFCLLIERIRLFLFEKLQINKLSVKVFDKFLSCLFNILKCLIVE